MKKIYAAAILIVLSGTNFAGSVHAQVSEDKISPEVQSLIEQVRSGKVKDVPPFPDFKNLSSDIKKFVENLETFSGNYQKSIDNLNLTKFLNTSRTQIQNLQGQLTQLLNDKGYLIGTEYAVNAQARLSEAKKYINVLATIQNSLAGLGNSLITVENSLKEAGSLLAEDNSFPQSIAVNRSVVPLEIDILNQLPPPNTYPGACYSYQGNEITGIIQYFNRQWRFQYGPNDYKPFLSEINDVGLIKSGKEYPITGRTPNGMSQRAWLGTDPATGKEVVVCLSHPFKVPPPHVAPAQKPKPSTEKKPKL